MASQLDNFLAHARDVSNVVIGTESATLSGGVVLTGVWSTVASSADTEFGGDQRMISASVIVPASSSITKSLIGKTCTYNGVNLRVTNVDTGTNESTVYFNDETQALTL